MDGARGHGVLSHHPSHKSTPAVGWQRRPGCKNPEDSSTSAPLGGEWQDASLSSLQSGEEGDIEIRYHGVMGRILRDRFGWVMEVPNLTAPAPSWEVAVVQTVSILLSLIHI